MGQQPYCILDKGQASYNPKQQRPYVKREKRMSCVLRVHGEHLDIDALLARLNLNPIVTWQTLWNLDI